MNPDPIVYTNWKGDYIQDWIHLALAGHLSALEHKAISPTVIVHTIRGIDSIFHHAELYNSRIQHSITLTAKTLLGQTVHPSNARAIADQFAESQSKLERLRQTLQPLNRR